MRGGERKILVVDDDPDMLTMLAMALSAAGYGTVLAISGEDALEAIGREAPDLILLDLRMPGMGGKGFAAAFHEQYGDTVPILLMTGHTEGRERAVEVGAAGYVAKPLDLDSLIAAIIVQIGTCRASDAGS